MARRPTRDSREKPWLPFFVNRFVLVFGGRANGFVGFVLADDFNVQECLFGRHLVHGWRISYSHSANPLPAGCPVARRAASRLGILIILPPLSTLSSNGV